MKTGNRAQLDALLAQLDQFCVTGHALALHIRFTRPSLLFRNYPPVLRDTWFGNLTGLSGIRRD